MFAANSTTPAASPEREIVITRVFKAPRELVFDAFTDAEHIGRWWGPDGFTITTHTRDVRPGGEWRFVMHGPDGADYDNRIVYRSIERPARLVYAHVDDTGRELFETTVTLLEQDGSTHLTFRAVFPSREARDLVVREHHAIEGGEQTLARLAAHIEHQAAAAGAGDREIVSARVFDWPRTRVFEAFSNPIQLAAWWGPKGFANRFLEFDLRPGGAWRFIMRGPDGTDYPMVKQFIEVAAPSRIVVRHIQQGHDFTMTMTFEEQDEKTTVTWRMLFDSAEEGEKLRTIISAANEENFDRLASYMAGATRRG